MKRSTVLGVVASVLALSIVGVPTAVSAQPDIVRAARCLAVDVQGMKLEDARALLRRNNCLPGGARDGRHYVVKTQCAPLAQFGFVVNQEPVGVRLGRHERLTLWRGVRTTDNGRNCDQLTDTVDENQRFDGTYEATFIITVSPVPTIIPVGNRLTGLAFEVDDSVMSGDFVGTINAQGVSTDLVMTYQGWRCTTPGGRSVTFTPGQSGAVAVAGNAVCVGEVTFEVRVEGRRT